MKKVILLCLLMITFTNILAQGTVNMPTTQGFLEKIFIDGLGTSFKYNDIRGSAYFDESFQTASPAKDYASVQARYNSYIDQIEFLQNNQIYVLPREDKFSRIVFAKSGDQLVLLNFEEKQGYFFELYASNNKLLLKKVSTKLNIPEKSKNSYASNDEVPSFVTSNTYYIGIEEKFFELPSRRKKLYNLFPGKEKELEAQVKAKKIDINTEKGLIEIISLL